MEEVEDNEESINMAKTMRENPKSMINHFKNKRKIISNNIFKYKKDISSELKEYKTKSDFNITMYKKHKDKTEGFKNDYSKIKRKQKQKEKRLIDDLIYDYIVKKRIYINKEEMKENIFELSPLIEPSLYRLKMDYMLNYNRIKNEIKENESKNNNISEFIKTMYPNKRKDNFINNETIPKNKLLNQVNCLNDVKFMKRVNIMTKSKMIEKEQIKEDFIIKKIKHKNKELKKKGKIEDILNDQKSIKNSLIAIQNLNKIFNDDEKEENRKLLNNLASKTNREAKNTNLFEPTIVKSFPELLYDKLNKDKNVISKNNATNDSTSRTLIRPKNKSFTERLNYKKNKNKEANINKAKKNISYEKIHEILEAKKLIKKRLTSKSVKKNNLNKCMKDRDFERNNDTSRVYNKILNMSTDNRYSKKNEIFMKTFLKEKNYLFLDSINEKRPKNYFYSLKNIHSQFGNDFKRKDLYFSNSLLNNQKSINLFNELQNFRNTLRANENLLIKSLLIEKE